MLVLYETSAGLALFKAQDNDKLDNIDELWKTFDSPEAANKLYYIIF
jgi:nucleolar protein 58